MWAAGGLQRMRSLGHPCWGPELPIFSLLPCTVGSRLVQTSPLHGARRLQDGRGDRLVALCKFGHVMCAAELTLPPTCGL